MQSTKTVDKPIESTAHYYEAETVVRSPTERSRDHVQCSGSGSVGVHVVTHVVDEEVADVGEEVVVGEERRCQ